LSHSGFIYDETRFGVKYAFYQSNKNAAFQIIYVLSVLIIYLYVQIVKICW